MLKNLSEVLVLIQTDFSGETYQLKQNTKLFSEIKKNETLPTSFDKTCIATSVA